MTLGIMQPYFFPYLGYYQLVFAAEQGIFFDTAQYRRKSWMNRNRVLHPTQGWQYLSVPVHAPLGTSIGAARIADKATALRRIQGQLRHYRGKAPYFAPVMDLLENAFEASAGSSIAELNRRSVTVVCDYLGFPCRWKACSELALTLPPIEHPGQWALEIADALEATRYINAPGGRHLFRSQEWVERGIELRFLQPAPLAYDTKPYAFEENLSILDVLMWNHPDAVAAHLRRTLASTC